MKPHLSFCLLLITVLPLVAQSSGEKEPEDFKPSTVSSFMKSKYRWESLSAKKAVVRRENHTPLKRTAQDDAGHRASRENGETSRFTDEDRALDEVTLREMKVSEFHHPLFRMSEMKDIDTLVPESAPGVLKEKYFTDFENNVLNAWTLPLIGRSQEQLARERYRREKRIEVMGKAGKIAQIMYRWDPEKARELRRDIYEVHFQAAWDYPESRIKTP